VSIIILLLSACGSVEYGEVISENHNPPAATVNEIVIPTEINNPAINEPELETPSHSSFHDDGDPTAPHPFATALKDYMEDYDGVVRAFLVTLDDDGTMGVLATRPTTRELVGYDSEEYGYGFSGTLFYIQDGELFQIDASWLFVSGKYNRLVDRVHGHTHEAEFIFKLEFGRLETSTRLEYFSDEYLEYLSDGNYDWLAERIFERDSRAAYAREKYGLVSLLPPNFGHMRNTQDQTAQILAMTANCVPSLDTTTTITQTGQISVTIGDIPVNFATGQPVVVDGRVLVPAFEFFDLLGFLVTWQPHTQQIRLLGNAGCIVIILNSDSFIRNYYSANRSYHTLDVPARVIDGTAMVPVCAILESVGFYDVQWDEATQTLSITSSN